MGCNFFLWTVSKVSGLMRQSVQSPGYDGDDPSGCEEEIRKKMKTDHQFE